MAKPATGIAKIGGSSERVTDLPIITSPGTDNYRTLHFILRQLEDNGSFFEAALLVDAMMRDDRIFGCSQTRINGLLGTSLRFEMADDRPESERALALVEGDDDSPGLFSQIFTPSVVADLLFWGRWLGIGVAEIIWDVSGEMAVPRLKIWHPQFIQWDWGTRSYWINTEGGREELPRTDRDPHSDGKWVVFTPFGFQYAWLKGLVRPVSKLYMGRGWAIRDWLRSSEKNGMAIDLVYVPATAPEAEANAFFSKVSKRNAETAIKVPRSEGDGLSYDVKMLEATARNWEVFKELNDRLNTDIAVCVLGQSETTEATPGLGGGNQRGEAVRGDYKASDAHALEYVMYHQVLTWWGKYNFDDPGVAPRPVYDLDPPDDMKAKAEALSTLGQALVSFLDAGAPVDIRAVLESFDIPMRAIENMPALPTPGGEQPSLPAADIQGTGAVDLTPTVQGSIITVNEAREKLGLGPLLTGDGSKDPDGSLTIAEYTAKKASIIAQGQAAEQGQEGPAKVTTEQSLRSATAARIGRRYEDRLAERALRRGGAAMAPMLDKIKAAIDAATSYDDLKKRLLRVYDGADSKATQRLLERAIIMAKLAGRHDVLEAI